MINLIGVRFLLVWPLFCPVACFTCQFVYASFVMVLRCVVDFGFGQLLQCVCTFKGYLYVSLFEEVGYLSDFGTVISEGGPFIVVATTIE